LTHGAVVEVRGDGNFSGASLSVNQPWTNHGTVQLTSVVNNQQALIDGAAPSIENGGLPDAQVGTGGSRVINAALDNQGSVTISRSEERRVGKECRTRSRGRWKKEKSKTENLGGGTFSRTWTMAENESETVQINNGDFAWQGW